MPSTTAKPTDSLSHTEQTASTLARLGLPREALPRHVAVIMDGNGRWARRQDKPRIFGHATGAATVRAITTTCARLELEQLTLYSFSTENWNRPQEEVDFLMGLYVQHLQAERETMIENNVRFQQIGRREGLPQPVLDELDRTVEITRHHTGLTLCLAINYGSRAEITDAVRRIAEQAQAGTLDPASIDDQTISDHLYTSGMPDPDLLIRTAGEMRLSNYLLWQLSYAELYVADCCWPDFDEDQLFIALHEYARRTRKYGRVVEED